MKSAVTSYCGLFQGALGFFLSCNSEALLASSLPFTISSSFWIGHADLVIVWFCHMLLSEKGCFSDPFSFCNWNADCCWAKSLLTGGVEGENRSESFLKSQTTLWFLKQNKNCIIYFCIRNLQRPGITWVVEMFIQCIWDRRELAPTLPLSWKKGFDASSIPLIKFHLFAKEKKAFV